MQSLLRIGTASLVFLAIIGSFSFCLLTIGATDGMSNAMHQDQSSFLTHLDHVKVLGSTTISRLEISILSVLLLVSTAFAFVVFSYTSLLTPPVRRRGYRESSTAFANQLKHHWLSRFVRSPEHFRPV
jgi:hypothetical protein